MAPSNDDHHPPETVRTKNVGSLDRKVLEFLVCPVTKGSLRYDAHTQELCSMAEQNLNAEKKIKTKSKMLGSMLAI